MFTFVICKNDLNIAFDTLEIPLQHNLQQWKNIVFICLHCSDLDFVCCSNSHSVSVFSRLIMDIIHSCSNHLL